MKNDAFPKFLPYHYPAIFERTLKATENSQGVICALLCATALEAFVHDFIGWYEFVRTNPISYGEGSYPRDNYLSSDEINILAKLTLSEKERDSVCDKFHCFSAWDISEQPYQDFKTLISIRNSLAHLKPEELTRQSESDFIEGYPKFLNNFFQRRMVEKPKDFISWIEIIETQEFCLWCQSATYEMVKKTISRLPDTNTRKHFSEKISFPFNVDVSRKRLSSHSINGA